jgi:hypothetical protein
MSQPSSEIINWLFLQTVLFRPCGPHQCSASEQDESDCYLQSPLMPHECGTSKPCQSAQTASSERAQCVSGKAHPVERSIWPKCHRALSNYRRYRFGLVGLISVVHQSRMKVTAIYSHLWHRIKIHIEGPLTSEALKFLSSRMSHYACWPPFS